METRANYVLIGLFTLAVVIGAFGFVYWFSNIGGSGDRVTYRVVFQGPIGGLRTGAAVMFNGIRVGDVTNLELDPKNPKQSLATISVESTTPVRTDTEVSLDFQGLTGIAALALRGGSLTAKPLVANGDEPAVLTADSSATQEMTAAAREVLGRLNSFLAENQNSLKNSIKNIETFTDTLSKNSGKIESSIEGVQKFSEALGRNSARVDSIMAGVDNLIGGPDGKGEVPAAVRAIKTAAENLDKRIDALVTDGRRTLNTIERTVNNFDKNPQRILFGGSSNNAETTPAQQPAPTAAPARRTGR